VTLDVMESGQTCRTPGVEVCFILEQYLYHLEVSVVSSGMQWRMSRILGDPRMNHCDGEAVPVGSDWNPHSAAGNLACGER
jgi:hypothetical protein